MSARPAAAVALRPILEPDLEVLARFDTDPAASEPFQWGGYRSPQVRRRRWEEDGLLGGEQSLLGVIVAENVFAGIVSWRQVRPGGHEGGGIEIGVLLFPEHRGHGIGTAAQALLVDHLWATTIVHRVQAVTDVENVAEQHALEKLGFRREGVLRGAAFVGGQWRDGAIYARLRDDDQP